MPVIFTPAATTAHPDVVPYISASDYKNAPTSVDVSSLIPSGTSQANLLELANVIRRASSWADELCYQILAATLDVQMASEVRVRQDGTIWVPCDFWPVLELDTFSVGPTPSTLTAVTNTGDIWLRGRKTLVVPVAGLSGTSTTFSYPGPLQPGRRAYAQWGYWNGWPHSTLAATVTSGATSLTLKTTQPAALAGRTITIWDGANTEQVQVASTFAGGVTIPLVAGTLQTHTLPGAPDSIIVSTFPDAIRQAVISLTSTLIKTRGAEGYEMEAIGEGPRRSAEIEGGGLEDLSVAIDLLQRYHRAA